MSTSQRAPLRLESLTLATLEPAVELVCHIWVTDNTIARALKATRDDYMPEARAVCEQALADDLGILIVDNRSGQIVGFHLSIDMYDELALRRDSLDGPPSTSPTSRVVSMRVHGRLRVL